LKSRIISAKIHLNTKANVITSSAQSYRECPIVGIVRGIVDETNLQLAGVKNLLITISQQEVAGRKDGILILRFLAKLDSHFFSTAKYLTVFGLIFLKKITCL